MCLKNILLLFYFITFTPKSFALAVATVSAEISAILLNKIGKIPSNCCATLLVLRTLANSAQNRRILTSLHTAMWNSLQVVESGKHSSTYQVSAIQSMSQLKSL